MNTENKEKVYNRFKNSVTLKLVTITVLMLLLLIPTSMIKSVIRERERLNRDAIEEVSAKWAGPQQVNGPVLTVPLLYRYGKGEKAYTKIKYWHMLPENLVINGKVEPKKLRRGIYEVVVYNSNINVSGTFLLSHNPDPTNLLEIQYNKAFLTVGISDLRGIKNNIQFSWGNKKYSITPGSKIPDLIKKGITIDVPELLSREGKQVPFNFDIDLQGSKNLSFIPIGSTTEVQLSSSWSSPSFNGSFLPDSREVADNGFSAAWKILQLNRSYPQSWIGTENVNNIQDSAFGVDLILPLDDYQKSNRSVKYAAMTIALTFLIFFLVEVLNKTRIHPLQYALVGLALSLFYILLVSISEHSNFNNAYGISTFGIVAMIGLYSLSIFKVRKLTILLIGILCGIYGFLFVTLQMADYALLMGSIGLTVILALTMFFTRNVNWYKLNADLDKSSLQFK